MKRNRLPAVLFVLLLGGGLVFTLGQLSGELNNIFPYLATPQRPPTPPQIVAQKIVEEPVPPTTSEIPSPSSPENDSVAVLDTLDNETKSPRRPLGGWVRISPIPMPIATAPSSGHDFSVPLPLAPMVEFWQKIYAVYDTKQIVFHDEENLGIQYSVLDLRQGLGQLTTDAEKKNYRDEMVAREMNRIKTLLTDPEARKRVRSQVGLKDRFEEGLVRAGRYLPYFEQIFAGYGVPTEISRLPFVESLFKERAFSKVAAAGLWQFMAGTARQYMVVDSLVDERYDPIRAAHAAARLLLKNYRLLKTWPLAISAYNTGPGNLLNAINRLGTRDIATIIASHRGGGYGFASRNFYPEFLAALGTYENYPRFFGHIKIDPPWEFDTLQLPGTMTVPEVAFLANMTLREIKELNPAFSEAVYDGKYPLSAGADLRLTPGAQRLFAARFLEYYHAGASPKLHVVREGDTLASVAHRYGLSSEELRSLNQSNTVREGRVLILPMGRTIASDQGNPTL